MYENLVWAKEIHTIFARGISWPLGFEVHFPLHKVQSSHLHAHDAVRVSDQRGLLGASQASWL